MIRSGVLRYRYLFSQLVRRELRQKYKGSALGILWYFINPLVIMAMYEFLLGPLLKAVHYPDYPVFILAGLLVWLFWSQSLLSGATALVDQTSLVSKVRFPRQTVPTAVVTVQLVPFFAMLVVLLPVAMALRGDASLAMFELIPLILFLFVLTVGMCLALAVLHAYYRDVQPILNAALLPLFFASGILFSIEQLPGLDSHPWAGPLLHWGNPIAPYIDSVRTVVYSGRTPSAADLVYVVAAAAVSICVGLVVFRRMEGELAVVL
jgi:ABC-type polysaccharide/polyol phosphate export permease